MRTNKLKTFLQQTKEGSSLFLSINVIFIDRWWKIPLTQSLVIVLCITCQSEQCRSHFLTALVQVLAHQTHHVKHLKTKSSSGVHTDYSESLSDWKRPSFSSPVWVQHCSDCWPCRHSLAEAESGDWRSPSPPEWHSPALTPSLLASDPTTKWQIHKHVYEMIMHEASCRNEQ